MARKLPTSVALLRQLQFAGIAGRKALLDRIADVYGAGFARSIAEAADAARAEAEKDAAAEVMDHAGRR